MRAMETIPPSILVLNQFVIYPMRKHHMHILMKWV